MVLHISAYVLVTMFSIDFSGLVIALAILDPLCWIKSVMISTSSYGVSNRFLRSSLNSIFFDPICVVSTLCALLVIIFHFYVQFDVDHNHYVVASNVNLVDDCYVCDDVWSVC